MAGAPSRVGERQAMPSNVGRTDAATPADDTVPALRLTGDRRGWVGTATAGIKAGTTRTLMVCRPVAPAGYGGAWGSAAVSAGPRRAPATGGCPG
jgi:hypothetical protein